MKYWNEKIETMPAEEMRKFQLENLKKTVKWVYDKVPFYKNKFDEVGPQGTGRPFEIAFYR
jgi:phenylacetate-CoA ligase